MPPATPILPGDIPASIAHAATLLRGGKLVAMPTETVYGLAGNALDPAAVARIFEAKQRPSFDPLIVHVPSVEIAHQLATFDELAEQLAKTFWPGPLTLVLPRKIEKTTGQPIVPDLVTSGLDSVGLRVPNHPVAQKLLRESNLPLAAPSANRFGSISPTTAQHVKDELYGRIAAIIDGGPCTQGVESTVIKIADGKATVLRLGALPIEAIEQVIGKVSVSAPSSSPGNADDNTPKPAPGMTDRHYAPGTPMQLLDSDADPLDHRPAANRVGLIGIGDLSKYNDHFTLCRSLSTTGDLAEAAANLFATLRELDATNLDRILALPAPDTGLGRAINDRLRRGSV